MSRLIFQLSGSVGLDNLTHVQISLSEPPVFGVPAHPFQCTGDEQPLAVLRDTRLPIDGVTRTAGRFLFEEVMRHPGVASQLPVALNTQPPDRCPVFVELATGAEVEALPWETLCAPSGEFLGLDERWSLGRIVNSPIVREPYWYLEPPVRIAVVLSCLGIPAADEWQALRDAVAAAPGVPVELLVVVSEKELYEQVLDEGGGVRVELVPEDLADLQRLISGFRPHLLHFFCHGSVQGGPHLQLAFGTDWDTGRADHSLNVEAREFRDFVEGAGDPPWLTVLNCCEGAAVGDGPDSMQSLALRLVYEGGLPAVVAMRESVPGDDANLFTRAFYKRLLAELAERAAGSGAGPEAAEPVDWAMLLVAARTRLAHKHTDMTLSQAAASTKEWTLPAVYLRHPHGQGPARPGGPPPAVDSDTDGDGDGGPPTLRAARKEIEALQGLLAQLPPSAPQALRAEAEQRLGELAGLLEHR
ncbi:CHAT domain-containing protein [Kitasatospora sp. MBT63]|uniref:CHAT domain-containing protein n=1 Tax=Kitasatospora sp. MBT63 TaxID=1444768 RepID=UPI00053AA0B7|nr:CHAT domain-containing protein [Kitasatospora sp. MBT63]